MIVSRSSATDISSSEMRRVLRRVLAEFPLRHHGPHGFLHWARVLGNARRIADRAGFPRRIVELFALLHDSKRQLESVDRGHGERAAVFARQLVDEEVIHLGGDELKLLEYACRWHSAKRMEAEPLVQVCWDADRLDLGRVGVEPRRDLLYTQAAREDDIFEWACERGKSRHISELIGLEWGIHVSGRTIRYPWSESGEQ
jgi:uncharacterized protein